MVNPLTTHNGILTVHNPATGQHRTFRIRTQPKDAKFAPGKRTVALLTGPQNTTDYTGFAFLETTPNGAVDLRVWRKRRAPVGQPFTQYELLARFLERLGTVAGVEINFEGACRVCNRALTTPESVAEGIGPVCGGRQGQGEGANMLPGMAGAEVE